MTAQDFSYPPPTFLPASAPFPPNARRSEDQPQRDHAAAGGERAPLTPALQSWLRIFPGL
jgi:hypothetical protein